MLAERVAVVFLVTFLDLVQSTLSSVDGNHFPADRPKRCLRHRAYGKVSTDCYGRNFQAVPDTINNDVQALDLSFNRIRELNSDSFSKYTDLELLFLDDNMISFIANDTFEPLQNLEVVLLSLNAINKVPTSLFTLPYLRKIDLSNNRLQVDSLSIFGTAPNTNQIKWLSLSDCHLPHLPPLQKFVHLEYLNVSNNPLDHLDAREIAPLCSLKTLDLGESFTLLSNCDCLLMKQWVKEDSMSVLPTEALGCTATDDVEKNCRSTNHTRLAQRTRSQCTKVVAEQERHAYMSKEGYSTTELVTSTLLEETTLL